jgi:hypothetical protein
MNTQGIMRKLTLICAMFAVALVVLPAVAQDKPNILVIWGDDIGWFNISAYNRGMMGYKTPNIDRIGNQGMLSPTPTVRTAVPRGARRSSRARAHSGPVY